MHLRSIIAAALASAIVGIAALAAGPAASDSQLTGVGQTEWSSDVRPGEVIIETVGDVDPTSDAVVDAVGRVRAEQQLRRAQQAQLDGRAGRTAAAVAGISVTYEGSVPSNVQAVVNAAVGDWNDAVGTTSGPVEITFDWAGGLPPGVLGMAGPTNYVRRSDGYYYPAALANTIANGDLFPGSPEIEVTISSGFSWYINAVDDDVPFNQLDLYATVLHEIGHGLGFLGSAQQAPGFGPTLGFPDPDKYDTLVRVDGTPLLSLPNPNSFLTSNNLDISIGGGHVHRLYAPSTFQNGSSFSHFDENTYPAGQPGSLMSPALANGEVERVVDAPVLGVLSESGWPMDVAPLTPTINSVTVSSGQVAVSWSINLSSSGTPPLTFVVEAAQGASVRASVTVAGAARSTTLTGLTNGQTYEIRVRPIGNEGAGTQDTETVQVVAVPDAPSLVNVTGSGLSRTVTWVAPNDGGNPITSYVIDRSINGGAFSQVGSTSNTSFPTGTLTNDVYQFRVRAVNSKGSSAHGYSLPVGFTDGVVRPLPLDGELARLFEAYLGREPDGGGLAYFIGQRAGGRSLSSVGDELAASQEFVEKYGTLTNRQFVEQLYINVFKRQGDSAGIGFWTSQLDAGTSRTAVVIGFSQSQEMITSTGTAAVQSSIDGAIYRLYLAYFLRPPDTAGQAFWSGQAASGVSFEAISAAFEASAEFVARYGSLSNTAFVELIYANVLTREPDQAGYDFWVAALNGGMSRGNVMLAFSQSAEFIIRTGTTP